MVLPEPIPPGEEIEEYSMKHSRYAFEYWRRQENGVSNNQSKK